MTKIGITTQDGVTLVDAKTLARILSVSVRTIRRLKSAGKLPCCVLVGASVRWRLLDITRWQELRCPDQVTFQNIMNTNERSKKNG